MLKKQEMDRTVILFCILALILGMMFFVGGLMLYIDTSKFNNNAVQTEGVITNINQYRKPDEDADRYETTVAFTADGVEYEGITNEWNRRMYVGQTITVFYNQENPCDFLLQMPSEIFTHIFILIGLCAIFMAVVFFKVETSQNVSSTLIGCMVFFILGILSFVGGLELHISNQNFKETAIQTESIIIDIDHHSESDSYYVTVAFTVRSVEYQGSIGEWDSDMYVGQSVTVFYNPKNPSDFRTCNPLAAKVLTQAGLLFLLIASSPYIMRLLKYIALKRFSGNNLSYNNENITYTKKNKVLSDAAFVLNKRDQPWAVTVKGDTIEAHWKWKSIDSVSSGVRIRENRFVFSVTLNDTGKWWENLDAMAATSSSSGFRESFVGKTYQKSLIFSIGKNKQTGKMKLKKDSEMDTATIKRAVREYLTACGWRKARLFGR